MDIAERLRIGPDDNWAGATMLEAADEIERLRRMIAAIKEANELHDRRAISAIIQKAMP